MITYQDLPEYANRSHIGLLTKKEWDNRIKIVTKAVEVQLGNIIKKNIIDIKTLPKINNDWDKVEKSLDSKQCPFLVYHFLLVTRCLHEYELKNDNKTLSCIYTLFFGGDSGYFPQHEEGLDYGHLKMLDKIYRSWLETQTHETYNMMKNVIEPYTAIMILVIKFFKQLYNIDETELILQELQNG